MVLSKAWSRLVDKSIDRVMDYVLRNCIIYNVAWEDPRIDGKVLQIDSEDTLLMLTTGGCNVLDRLLDGAKHIVSVDLNVAQNALLELKLAGARALTHEQFFQLFAHSNRKLFDALYAPRLRPLLSKSAAEFWDTHASFFDNAMYSGASGGLARGLVILTWLLGLQPLVREMLTCQTLEEQRALLKKHESKVDRLANLFNWLLPVFCPFAGVPASQFRLEEASRGDSEHSSIIHLMFDRIFKQTHIASDNYFYYAYLYGKYSRTCCPRYLKPENFEALKAAATRVDVRTQFLHEAAAEYPDGYFSAMVLLDHMDWLSTEQTLGEWAVFSRKLDPTKGRVLWRSFAYDLSSTPPLKFLHFDPRTVERAETAQPDRVGMYNSTHLATLPAGLRICEAPPAPAPVPLTATSAPRALALSLCALVAAAWALLSAALTTAATRVPLVGAPLSALVRLVVGALAALVAPLAAALLPHAPPSAQVRGAAKRSLLQLLPGMQGATWVDVGGGYAEELQTVAADNISHYAHARIVALPGDKVTPTAPSSPCKGPRATIHELHAPLGTATAYAEQLAAAGVAAGSADLVTLSSGLFGAADCTERVALALSLLKPGGYLALTDAAPPTSEASAAYWAVQSAPGAEYRDEAMRAIYRGTAELHAETLAAHTPLLRPSTPAHFLYIGEKRSA